MFKPEKISTMKKIILILALLTASVELMAQQDVQFTQYAFNQNSVNPAYTGSREALSFLTLFRKQWVGFDGAPTTLTFNVNSPAVKDYLGLGFTYTYDKIGPTVQNGMFADVAYRIRFAKQRKLSFGLRIGLSVFSAKFADLTTVDAGDALFQNNIKGKALFNFGFGIYYYSPKFYVGLSVPRLLRNDVNISDASTGNAQIAVNKMHYYFIMGYLFNVSPVVKIKPSTQIKFTPGAPLSADITACVILYDKFWVGAQYRIGDAAGLQAQFNITPQLRVGYSYDFSVSGLSRYNSGTHEIMLGYDLIFPKEKVKSPRYF